MSRHLPVLLVIAAPVAVAAPSLSLYEDANERPARSGLIATHIVQTKSSHDLVIATVHNRSDRVRRVGVRLHVPQRVSGVVHCWDGLGEHAPLADRVWRREPTDTFPMACVYNTSGGRAVGFHPDTRYSYLATSASRSELTYETRLVLKPGATSTVRFVTYTFSGRWGWRNALDHYYLAFPDWFRPHPKVDPRVWRGLDASMAAERYYHYHPYPELLRRGRLTYGWCYAPFKRAGDFYCRPQFWNFEPLSARSTGDRWGTRDPSAYLKRRHDLFENGRQANVAQLFYVSNACEKRLLDERYPDSAIRPLTDFGCLPDTQVSPRVFSAGGDFGRQMHQDLADICRENYVSGFAYDSSGGMGSRKYRGPLIWEMSHVAFDEGGPYVLEGVGHALNIRYMHKTPVLNGRYVAGCKINPGGEHPMPYMLNFAADNSMIEWSSLGSYADGDDAVDYSGPVRLLIGKHRRLMGQKPIVQHSTLRHDKFGAKFDWRAYAPDHVRLLYRMWWEYEVIACLHWGLRPYVDRLWGVPKMFAIVDLLMDLTSDRGWYAVPGAVAPDGVLVSRYGQGLRRAVVFGTLSPEPLTGQVTLYGDDLSGHAPIVCRYGGDAFAGTVGRGRTRGKIELRPRGFVVLDTLADYEGPDTWTVRASADRSRHEVSVRITNTSAKPIAGLFRFPERPGYSSVEARQATLEPGETLTITYRSSVYLSPDAALRDFPFLQSEIVLPAAAHDDLKLAANWLSGYFQFWHRFGPPQKSGVRVPTVPEPTGKALTVLLKTGAPRSVKVTDHGVAYTAPTPIEVAELVWESLSILDRKYPFHGKFHGGFPLWRDARRFNYQPRTLQMLREVGLLGGTLGLYEGPEPKDLPQRSPAQIKAMYDRIAASRARGPEAKTKPPPKRKISDTLNESFDSLDGLVCEKAYKCAAANAEVDLHQFKEGAGSVQATWTAQDRPGTVRLWKKTPETDTTGKRFELWLMPLDGNSTGFGLALYDTAGRRVEEHRVFHAKPNEWNRIVFDQGKKRRYQWFRRGDGNPAKVARVIFRAHTREAGVKAVLLWDGFRITDREE